jgi:regulatory protein
MDSDSPENQAFQAALRKLTRREQSTLEVRTFLRRREFPESAIEFALGRLKELRYLDDRRYAEALTRAVAARGKGPRAIQAKLRSKGVALTAEEITELVEAAQGKGDLERAREIVERRYPDFQSDASEAKRAYDALIRRGFSFEIARRALKN